MDVSGLLLELYGRIPPLAVSAVRGAKPADLVERVTPHANPIAWLVWHTARVQDHHLAEILDADQVWVGGDWAAHFGLEPDPRNLGYGHSSEDVAGPAG
jgi:hypothetical protein